jgi:arsenate reductase (glutaredoxin)
LLAISYQAFTFQLSAFSFELLAFSFHLFALAGGLNKIYKMKIFHNPRCKKSREGLAYLSEKTNQFTIVDYLKDGLGEEMLREILLKTNLPVEALVRKQEDFYKKELKGKQFNEDEWIRIIIENPKLLQRPILVSKTKGCLAHPPEKMDDVLG